MFRHNQQFLSRKGERPEKINGSEIIMLLIYFVIKQSNAFDVDTCSNSVLGCNNPLCKSGILTFS